MSVLASIAIVTKHSWKAYITVDEYEEQDFIQTHLTKPVFFIRVNAVRELVRIHYPSNFVENLVIIFSVASILLICVVSLLMHIMHNPTLQTTIPFFFIFIPIGTIFWGTRRRGTFQYRMHVFETSLATLMQEITQEDVTKEIKWEYRNVKPSDTWRTLKIAKPLCELTNVGIIVQAIHIDLTTQLEAMGVEHLPAYNESLPHTVMEVNDARLPHYHDLAAHEEDIDLTDLTRPSFLNPPLPSTALPEYVPAAPQIR